MISEIRPDDRGGAWIKTVYDLPALHDERLSEVIELNFYLVGIMGLSLNDIKRQAETKSGELLVRALQSSVAT